MEKELYDTTVNELIKEIQKILNGTVKECKDGDKVISSVDSTDAIISYEIEEILKDACCKIIVLNSALCISYKDTWVPIATFTVDLQTVKPNDAYGDVISKVSIKLIFKEIGKSTVRDMFGVVRKTNGVKNIPDDAGTPTKYTEKSYSWFKADKKEQPRQISDEEFANYMNKPED